MGQYVSLKTEMNSPKYFVYNYVTWNFHKSSSIISNEIEISTT